MKTLVTNMIYLLLASLLLFACMAPSAETASGEVSGEAPADESSTVPAVGASSAASTLRIATATESQSFTLEELKTALPIATFGVDDPVYDAPKTYEGFWLTDLLDYVGVMDGALEDGGLENAGDMLLFRAADGYETRLDLAKLGEGDAQGFVAFRDVEAADGWEPFVRGTTEMVPAPFYLVWGVSEDASPAEAEAFVWRDWPWPYQLVEIELIDFATTYERLYPDGIEANATVHDGFKLFTESCLKCHSVNLQGGNKGPELNIPQNITEYRDPETLMAFIKNPSSFRYSSLMPAMEDKYSDEELDAIVTYIAWMADHKWEVESE